MTEHSITHNTLKFKISFNNAQRIDPINILIDDMTDFNNNNPYYINRFNEAASGSSVERLKTRFIKLYDSSSTEDDYEENYISYNNDEANGCDRTYCTNLKKIKSASRFDGITTIGTDISDIIDNKYVYKDYRNCALHCSDTEKSSFESKFVFEFMP